MYLPAHSVLSVLVSFCPDQEEHTMTVIGTARRLTPALIVAAIAAGGLGAAQATAASAGTVSKDAAVSSTGKVMTTAQAATMVAVAQVHGRSSYAGKSATTTSSGVRPNSVIGADGRSLVNPTTGYPARATVLITRPGYSPWCTGWMISKDTLLTAGHCVYSGGAGGTWYGGLQFKPGSNGGTAPYGTCSARGTWALNGWVNSADWNYDTGIIKLNCTVGNTVGWYGMYWQTASLNGVGTTVQGYPGDKPSTQWISYDYVRASETEKIYYQNDTIGGESGSPVWTYRSSGACTGYCGLAVHAYGVGGSGYAATNNSGTRITQAKYNSYVSIINTP